jgi:hypothetical protein
MIIYNNNLQIIRLFISKIVKMNTRLRHVDIAQCWLRQSIQQRNWCEIFAHSLHDDKWNDQIIVFAEI